MELLAILIIPALTLLILTLRDLRRDGYGVRPGPPSHDPWAAGNLSSEPFRNLR